VARERFEDDGWKRLPWLLPGAAVLSLCALSVFLHVLISDPKAASPQRPIELQLVELPNPASAPATTLAPLIPPQAVTPPQKLPTTTTTDDKHLPTLPPPAIKHNPAARIPARHSPPPPFEPSPPTNAAPATAAPTAPPQPVQQSRAPPADESAGGNGGAQAIFKPMPEIPEALRRRKIEWVALARFAVATNGSAQVELVEATSEPLLNRLLLEALKRWRFVPALEDGKPVASTVEIRIPINVQ
jgi:periplasmic protein TonB